jgi:RNA polymerase sigma-70 factor (ECF subfamily)
VTGSHGAEDWCGDLDPGDRRCPWLPRGGNLRGWLFSIVHNAFISSAVASRGRAGLDDNLPELRQAPSQLDKLEVRDVLAALSRLPRRSRPRWCWFARGFSYAEAARVLRIPIGTLMSRLARARARAP